MPRFRRTLLDAGGLLDPNLISFERATHESIGMRTTSVGVFRIATKGPADVSGLTDLIESGVIDPNSILAILGKTEGNGGVNDFTREYAVAALCAALAPYLDLAPHQVEQKIAFVMSGGTEGVLSPHITVFTREIS